MVPKMIFRLNKEKEEEKEKSTKAAQVLFKTLQGLVFGLPYTALITFCYEGLIDCTIRPF